jgi:hypothetical protein
MTFKASKYLSLALWLLFAAGMALTLYISFKAGCAGDSKGGALGNPVRALQLEGYSMLALLFGAVSGGAAVGLWSRSVHRVAQGGAFATFILVCFWLAGMQFEIWGVQSCFLP